MKPIDSTGCTQRAQQVFQAWTEPARTSLVNGKAYGASVDREVDTRRRSRRECSLNEDWAARYQSRRRLFAGIAREPLVHFVLLGGALFLLAQQLPERSPLERITITREQVQAISESYRFQYGSRPSPQQLEALLNSHIRAEMFYREALKLGLDEDDEIVRRRLVQKYEFLQQDLTIPTEPTDAQLHAYYEQHLQQYRWPETVTFTHVYLSPDLRSDNGARDAAQAISWKLNLEGRSRAVESGDVFPGAYEFTARSQVELSRVFGREGFSEGIFKVEARRWSAPLRSGLGWHTVYVTERQPGRQSTFDEVRGRVRLDYKDAERQRRNEQAFAELSRRFEIVRE